MFGKHCVRVKCWPIFNFNLPTSHVTLLSLPVMAGWPGSHPLIAALCFEVSTSKGSAFRSGRVRRRKQLHCWVCWEGVEGQPHPPGRKEQPNHQEKHRCNTDFSWFFCCTCIGCLNTIPDANSSSLKIRWFFKWISFWGPNFQSRLC